MFHRVKSEGQDDEQQTTASTQSEITTASEKPAQDNKPATETQETQGQTTQLSQETQDTQDQKDETIMTEAEKTTTPQEPTPATTYQRTPTAVRSSGYPGAYPGAAASPSSEAASASDRRLTIGPGITMSGEIESCDYLLVEGTVEAALKGANVLEIAEAGVFYGTVEINEANIAGRFEGDITVNGRLTVSEGGAVTGSISYKEIAIEAGATVDGKLTPLAAAPAAAASKPAQAKPAAKPAAKNEKQPEPANSDGELFSKTAAAAE